VLPAILIEQASSGASLIQAFKEAVRIDHQVKTILLQRLDYRGPIDAELHPEVAPPIVPIKPDHDKLARAQAITPMVERGDMLLPDPSVFDVPWLRDFLTELLTFTGINDVHDDQVDSVTQLLNYIRGLGSFDVMTWWRKNAQQAEAGRRKVCLECTREIRIDQEDYRRVGEQYRHLKCPVNGPLAAG
jgi:predicted phage terminase large subunit-like protein